jgi:hypothetical protein
MADDTPAAPPPVDPWSMTRDQAAAALAVMDAKLHPPPPINPENAQDARRRLDELTNNKEWGARWIAGGIAEAKEYQRLSELANQADQVKNAIAGETPAPTLIETVGPNELSTRDLASAVETFRDAGLSDDVINQGMRGGKISRAEYMAAKALKSARHGDEGWRQRWLNGGWAEGREQWLLNIVLTSEIDESR